MIGWGDEKIAAYFGITSPDASTVFDWAVPFGLAIITLAIYHALAFPAATANGKSGAKIISQIPQRLYAEAKTARRALGLKVIFAWVIIVVSTVGLVAGVIMLATGSRRGSEMTSVPGDTMLSGRRVSGLEVVSRLEKLEKEHAATVSELSATKQKLGEKEKQLASAPTTPDKPLEPMMTEYDVSRRQKVIDEILDFLNIEFMPTNARCEKLKQRIFSAIAEKAAIAELDGQAETILRLRDLYYPLIARYMNFGDIYEAAFAAAWEPQALARSASLLRAELQEMEATRPKPTKLKYRLRTTLS